MRLLINITQCLTIAVLLAACGMAYTKPKGIKQSHEPLIAASNGLEMRWDGSAQCFHIQRPDGTGPCLQYQEFRELRKLLHRAEHPAKARHIAAHHAINGVPIDG